MRPDTLWIQSVSGTPRFSVSETSSLMSTDLQIREVISYLETEFPDFVVTLSHAPKGDVKFGLSSPEQDHVVFVEQSFLEGVRADDIKAQLDEFRLAATLRDIGEFPIVISIDGCIFP